MNERLVIINGRMILPEGIREGLCLICQNGKIQDIVPVDSYRRLSHDNILDAQGQYVSPGFIDIHVHGGGGHDFMDGTVEAYLGAAKAHAEHGTTSMVPTTLTCSDEELFRTFEVFRKAKELNTEGAELLGIHLEGPYFSPYQAGAQDPEYLQKPSPESYCRIMDASDDIIRWSVAPELDGALEMGLWLKQKGVLGSVGHSNAVYEDVEKAFEAGFTHITHLYSAMSSITRRNAYRYAGVVEAAYLIDDVTVEIIADGIHLPAPLLKFVYKFKGPEKTALCTDAMRGAGMPDGEYMLGSLEKGQAVIVEDGVAKLPDRSAFAGSVATADRLVRTMMTLAEVSLEDAVMMMTSTPAGILGLDWLKGALKPGYDADIVIFNDDIIISKTISHNHVIYSRN